MTSVIVLDVLDLPADTPAEAMVTAMVDLSAILGDVNRAGDLVGSVPASTITARVDELVADATIAPLKGVTP